MVRRVLVWVGSQLAANTLLLWNALHLANAPCPSSDRHTIHGHEAYLGEEKIEWSFMLQVIDFYATRESQHVKCFEMASNKWSLQRKTSKLDQCHLHQNQSWSSCRFSQKKNDTEKIMWEPLHAYPSATPLIFVAFCQYQNVLVNLKRYNFNMPDL